MPSAHRRPVDDDQELWDVPSRQPTTRRRPSRRTEHAADPLSALRETADPDPSVEPTWSTYVDALHGPEPIPGWAITSPAAIDEDLGVLKGGKEADVSLVRRIHDDRTSLMAAKRFRDPDHRMFHRDAAYLEGRRTRRTRDTRAMQRRTEYGRALIAGQWAAVEFDALCRLWSAGVSVPYPVQLSGTELMMELIGDDDGTAAPRLAATRPDVPTARAWFDQLHAALVGMAELGVTHGDLSPYNVLVHDDRIVLIDLPQLVDIVANPQGPAFVRRDCHNIASWFAARGVPVDADELSEELLTLLPSVR